MRIYQRSKSGMTGLLLLACCLFLLVACGSTTTGNTGSSSSPASATSTACAQKTRPATAFKTSSGILKTISGQTLTLTTIQGGSAKVTYSSSTTFTQEVKLAPGDLTEGTSVRVAVVSTGSTYTAASVTVSNGTTTTGPGRGGFPGFTGTPGARKTPCFGANRGRFVNGNGTNSTFRGLVGTVSGINGNVLTITDTTGASFTVNLTDQTQIIETKSATASALKVGDALTAVGKADAQNSIAASSIAILLSLPKRGLPGATPTA